MHEVKCIVKDKDLGAVSRALKPYALEPAVFIPVGELDKNDPVASVGTSTKRKKHGGPRPKKSANDKRGGSHKKMGLQIIQDYLRGIIALHRDFNNPPTVKTKQLKHHLMGHGYSLGAYYPIQQQLLATGDLKRIPDEPSVYEVHITHEQSQES